jgi:hypothetical protein
MNQQNCVLCMAMIQSINGSTFWDKYGSNIDKDYAYKSAEPRSNTKFNLILQNRKFTLF